MAKILVYGWMFQDMENNAFSSGSNRPRCNTSWINGDPAVQFVESSDD
jgi:hypothetical protein